MIKLSQIAQRLAFRLFERELNELHLNAQEAIRDGLNLALIEFGSLLPAHRTEKPLYLVMEQPQAVQATVTRGSATVAFTNSFPLGMYATALDLAGKTVQMAGSGLNRLVSSTQLAMPWLGSSGSKTGMVYADGALLNRRMEQLVGEVRWKPEAGEEKKLDLQTPPQTDMESPSLGTPRFAWLESIGGADATENRQLLRVWPIPSVIGAVVVPVRQFAAGITLEDMLVTKREIPVDEEEAGLVSSLAAPHLLGCTGLREGLSANDFVVAATAARSLLMTRHNPNPSGVPHKVGTPANW